MKVLFIISKVVIGILMVLTGIYGLNNIDFAEYLLVDIGAAGWLSAVYFIRFVIGLLIASGLLLIFGFGKQRPYIQLAFFTNFIFLIYQILQVVTSELPKCYVCLSEYDNISRFQGIYLFLGFVIILAILLTRRVELKHFKWNKLIIGLCLLIGFIIPFVLNYPAHWVIYGEIPRSEVNRKLELEGIQNTGQLVKGKLDPHLEKGEHLVAMISLTCPYCARAAYKLHLLKERNPQAKITLVLHGDSSDFPRFERRTLIYNLPMVFASDTLFSKLSDNSYPKIYKVKDGNAFEEIEFWALDDKDIPLEQ